MNECRRLRDGSAHCDRTWIVRPRIGPCAASSPAGETVASGWRGTNRNSHTASFPSASGTHPTSDSVGHGQEILRLECGCVGRVGGRRDSVRDRAMIVPLGPYVLNACATALRRSRSYGVT